MAKGLRINDVRCIYPNLSTPKIFKGETGAGKYGLKILIPKKDKGAHTAVLEYIKAEIAATPWTAAQKAQVLKLATNHDGGYNDRCVIKDGDCINAVRVDNELEPVNAYKDHWVISLGRRASFGPPATYDQAAQPVPPALVNATILGGYWVNVHTRAYAYDKPTPGISLTLSAVQLVRVDEAFGVLFTAVSDEANPFERSAADDTSVATTPDFSGDKAVASR